MAAGSSKRWSPKTWSKRTKIIAAITAGVVVVGSAGTIIWLVTKPSDAATAQAVSVTATAQRSTYEETVTATGTLATQNQSYLSFPTQGTVLTVGVKVGDSVTKGQVLATQESDSLEAAVTEADAAVTAAQASVDALDDDSNAQSEQIAAAAAQLASAKTKLVEAEDNLDGASMTSPIAGIVAEVNIDVGEKSAGGSSTTTGPGTSMSSSSSTTGDIVVVDTTSWQVEASVSMSDVANLKKNQEATVVPDGSTDSLDGTVASIDLVGSSSSSGSATFPVTVTIDGSPDGLYIGGSADLTIVVSSEDALTVPTAAITTTDGQAYVTLRTGSEDVSTPVTVGRTFGSASEITDGISEGDTVVYTSQFGGRGSGQSNQTPSGDQSGASDGQMPNGGAMPTGAMPEGFQPGNGQPGAQQSGR